MKGINTIKLIIIAVIIVLLTIIAALGFQNNWWKGNSNNTVIPTLTPAVNSPTPTLSITDTPAPTVTPNPLQMKVYFSKHNDSDNDPSKVFPLSRIAPDSQVATYGIKQLIQGPSSLETSLGYYSELQGKLLGTSNCSGADFQILLNTKGSKSEQGTATLKFCKTTSLSGDLSGARIKAEIENTLTQFNTIKKVVILNKDGGCFDDLSGQNLCLK